MLKLILGSMLGIIATLAGVKAIWIVLGFGAVGAFLYVESSRTMKACLATCENVESGGLSGGDVRKLVSAPLVALVMGFLGKAFCVAAVWGVLVAAEIVKLP